MGLANGVDLADIELSDDRLLLRRWVADDAARVRSVMQDRSMYEFLSLPDPYDEDAAREYVTDLGHEGRGDGTGLGCAVVEKASGRVVGAAALRLGVRAELGYWTAPDARGHGYAAAACRLLSDFGFERLALPRISIFADVRNVGSVRTALAAGFAYEGTVRDAAPVAGSGTGDVAWFGRLATDPGAPIASAFPLVPSDLGDGVVSLRVLAPDDADELAELDDEVALGVGFGRAAFTDSENKRAADRGELDRLVGTRVPIAIVDAATDAFAGLVTVRQSGPPAVWGIGYVVHPLFRGRGYTTRALRLLAPWAFAHGAARLELGAKIDNVASQRVALASGFEPEAIFRARLRNPDGTFTDEQRFFLLPEAPRVAEA